MVQPPEQRLVVEAKIGVPGTVANNAVKAAALDAVESSEVMDVATTGAVAQKLTQFGVVSGGAPIISGDSAFAITDSEGRRSWVEIGADGRPTAHATGLIGDAVTPRIDSRIAAIPNRPAPVADFQQVAFSITDSNDRRSWLEVGMDGGPTQHATDAIVEAVTPSIGPIALGSSRSKETGEHIGVAYGVVDQNDRRSDLEIGMDGHITQRVIDLWSSRIVPVTPKASIYDVEVAGTSPNRALYLNADNGDRKLVTNQGDPRNPYMTPDGWVIFETNTGVKATKTSPIAVVNAASALNALTQWGDSLTQAGTIRTRLIQLLPAGTSVINEGIGGQTAPQIAARQGGEVAAVTVTDNVIPASGPVTITDAPIKFLYGYAGPNNKQNATSRTGTLAGVPGTVSMAAVPEFGTETYIFTRAQSGTAVGCPAGTPFIFDNALAARGNTQILWTGRNNPYLDVVDATKKMVAYLSPHTKRFLVLSTTTATNETAGTSTYTRIMAINAEQKAIWGDRFVDIRQHLVDNGLALAGITPTQADLDAIAGDTIPPSLMNTNDTIHFNAAGQTVIADKIYERMTQKGWY